MKEYKTICSECGKVTRNNYGGLCQNCYLYFKNGGKIYPLPEAGKIEHDENGKVICHICGRSFKRLGSHVRVSHDMTIKEYKEEFGLCSHARTTEETYSKIMRENAYKNNMDKVIVEAGKATRIKKGETDKRKNKKVRLQEILNKRNRGKMKNKSNQDSNRSNRGKVESKK